LELELFMVVLVIFFQRGLFIKHTLLVSARTSCCYLLRLKHLVLDLLLNVLETLGVVGLGLFRVDARASQGCHLANAHEERDKQAHKED